MEKKTKTFSACWKSSKRPRKQRNYRRNAPLHTKRKFLGSTLSKELKKKHGVRTMQVVKGDKVKISRGQHKGRENKVEKVDVKEGKIFITGVEMAKKDGSKSAYPINPSNVVITELNLEDKKRKEALERKVAKGKITKKPASKPVKTETKQAEAKPNTGTEAKAEVKQDTEVKQGTEAKKAETKPAQKKEGEQ